MFVLNAQLKRPFIYRASLAIIEVNFHAIYQLRFDVEIILCYIDAKKIVFVYGVYQQFECLFYNHFIVDETTDT